MGTVAIVADEELIQRHLHLVNGLEPSKPTLDAERARLVVCGGTDPRYCLIGTRSPLRPGLSPDQGGEEAPRLCPTFRRDSVTTVLCVAKC